MACNQFRQHVAADSPVISEIGRLEIGDIQNVFVTFRVHHPAIGGIEKEWILVPHHLQKQADQSDSLFT